MIKLIRIPALSLVREVGRASNDEDAAIGARNGANGAVSDGGDGEGDEPAERKKNPARIGDSDPRDSDLYPDGHTCSPLLREGGLTPVLIAIPSGGPIAPMGGLFTSPAGEKASRPTPAPAQSGSARVVTRAKSPGGVA